MDHTAERHEMDFVAPKRLSRGFSIVELLVSVGIVMILLSLALPAFGGLRSEGRSLKGASNMRQIGLAFAAYTDENDGKPPVYFPPIYVESGRDFMELDLSDHTRRGWYFANAWAFHLALQPTLHPSVLIAPENPNEVELTRQEGGVTARDSDYELTHTLWTQPEFWRPEMTLGPESWVEQPLHRVRYPSSKGLLLQHVTYTDGSKDLVFNNPAFDIPILWSDQSASRQRLDSLRHGVFNTWWPDVSRTVPLYTPGSTILNTRDGVLGRDR